MEKMILLLDYNNYNNNKYFSLILLNNQSQFVWNIMAGVQHLPVGSTNIINFL